MSLPTATLGRTGETVTKLGFGAMEVRDPQADEREVAALLNQVLDAGVNLIDTSPDYAASEMHIGRAISHRRDEFFLATKCGCPVGDDLPRATLPHVFTPENIRAAVEQSLRRMNTDHVDLVQFHISPSRETLEDEGSVEALAALRDEGKVRFLGMSGTLPNLPDHIAMGVFDAFQIPYSAVERDHEQLITDAANAGAGTIIRGGVARGLSVPDREMPERFRQSIEARRERYASADVSDLIGDMTPQALLLRFTISHPDMHTTIVGTKNPEHFAANVAAAEQGPLPDDLYQEVKRRFA